MYSDAFGLVELPFSNTPDPRFFFSTTDHEEALAALVYTVGELKGSILLTGESGTGKSMLVHMMLEHFGNRAVSACVGGGAVRERSLPEVVCDAFSLDYHTSQPGRRALNCLQEFLGVQHRRDRPTVLILDDAERLTVRDLDDLRVLSAIQTRMGQALQIVLVGQPELQEKIEHPALAGLRRRFFRVTRLRPLSRGQTAQYVQHRLTVAGLPPEETVFNQSALDVVFELSRGIPGIINTVADNAMLSAFARGESTITAPMLRECDDLRFHLRARAATDANRAPIADELHTATTATQSGNTAGNPPNPQPMYPSPRPATPTAAPTAAASAESLFAPANVNPTHPFASAVVCLESHLNRIEHRIGQLEQAHGHATTTTPPNPQPTAPSEHAAEVLDAIRSLSATVDKATRLAFSQLHQAKTEEQPNDGPTNTNTNAVTDTDTENRYRPPIGNTLTDDLMSRTVHTGKTPPNTAPTPTPQPSSPSPGATSRNPDQDRLDNSVPAPTPKDAPATTAHKQNGTPSRRTPDSREASTLSSQARHPNRSAPTDSVKRAREAMVTIVAKLQRQPGILIPDDDDQPASHD